MMPVKDAETDPAYNYGIREGIAWLTDPHRMIGGPRSYTWKIAGTPSWGCPTFFGMVGSGASGLGMQGPRKWKMKRSSHPKDVAACLAIKSPRTLPMLDKCIYVDPAWDIVPQSSLIYLVWPH